MGFLLPVGLLGVCLLLLGVAEILKGRRSFGVKMLVTGIVVLSLCWYILHSWDRAMKRAWDQSTTTRSR